METLAVNLLFRPIRLGLCVKIDDAEGFRRAIRLTNVLWGGRYNPIIPYDRSYAEALVRLFRVDALLPVTNDPGAKAFAEKFSHLPWPFFHDGLFIGTPGDYRRPQIVDIWHPISRIVRERRPDRSPDSVPEIDIVTWDSSDPLSDVFLCKFGGLATYDEVGIDYPRFVRENLQPGNVNVESGANLPVLRRHMVADINQAFVQRHYSIRNNWDNPGFYVGNAESIEDLVTFWNLRAADIQLEFFDPNFSPRFEDVKVDWSEKVREALVRTKGLHRYLPLWHREAVPIREPQSFGDNVAVHGVSDDTWNGLGVKAPLMYFGDTRALAAISNSDTRPQIAFSIAERPFAEEDGAHDQHYVLSVDPGIGLFRNERATLHLPFIPELNEFYGRNCHFIWNCARAEPESLGIITAADTTELSLHAADVTRLVVEIFKTVGIEAAPSKPGLVCTSLIRQMGGLDGCRSFKIAGVRSLIEKYRPDQSFDRGCALQTIRGQDSNWPIEKYQWLYIEPRKPGVPLKASAVFAYLLEKGVFRAGLKFTCPSCLLDFWLSLDAARSRVECEFCGNVFNAGPQLRDRGWAFRKSGLFGRDDHQEGAVPVVLTLQQIARASSSVSAFTYTTAMDLRPAGANISACETDFVVVHGDRPSGKIQIVIGECKTRKPITAADVTNLKAVAEAFPSDKYDVFVVFAKLAEFSDEELGLIKEVQGKYRNRAILLTDRELEPYFIYERTKEGFDIDPIAVGFERMAHITRQVFFEKKRRL